MNIKQVNAIIKQGQKLNVIRIQISITKIFEAKKRLDNFYDGDVLQIRDELSNCIANLRKIEEKYKRIYDAKS